MVVARRPRFAWIEPLAAWRMTPRAWATAALILGLAAAAGDQGWTASGCTRCAPDVGLNPVFPMFTPRNVGPARREERRQPEQRTAGGAYTVCVRACDGSFFPVTYFGAATRADGLENVCRALCPNAEVALYSFPFGGTIDEAVSSTGEPYDRLPNAHKFEQAYDPSCSCRAPGQSWAEALARAEAKYGGQSHDVVVTAAVAERMSRPAQPPGGKPAAAAPTAGLDVNGVDSELLAATEAMSRAGSGIRGDDRQRAPRYSLNAGRPAQETAPDGSTRRVRILP